MIVAPASKYQAIAKEETITEEASDCIIGDNLTGKFHCISLSGRRKCRLIRLKISAVAPDIDLMLVLMAGSLLVMIYFRCPASSLNNHWLPATAPRI